MAHKRQTIRDTVKAILIGNTDVSDSSIYTNRVRNVLSGTLPAMVISTSNEAATKRKHISSNQFIRELDLSIMIIGQGDNTLDDDLDDIADQVEDVFKANNNISGQALKHEYVSSELEIQSNAQKQIGNLTIVFKITYIY